MHYYRQILLVMWGKDIGMKDISEILQEALDTIADTLSDTVAVVLEQGMEEFGYDEKLILEIHKAVINWQKRTSN